MEVVKITCYAVLCPLDLMTERWRHAGFALPDCGSSLLQAHLHIGLTYYKYGNLMSCGHPKAINGLHTKLVFII